MGMGGHGGMCGSEMGTVRILEWMIKSTQITWHLNDPNKVIS